MKWSGLLLMSMMLLASCAKAPEDNSPEYQASQAAKKCYETLYLEGHTTAFLDGRASATVMPPAFRKDLLQTYNRHVRQVQAERQGVRAVEVARAQVDSILHVTDVFLTLTYGDGSKEEILVPMVQLDGQWRMK